MKYRLSILSSVISATLLSGCGFEVEKNVVEPLPPALTGQFVDSAVGGIQYERVNINGIAVEGETDANGNFEYFRGDRIIFKIGDLKLPEISPKNFVTPLSFFRTDNPVAPQIANLARLLQSLDTDGNPENGITISPQARFFAQNKGDDESIEEFFNRTPEDFAAAVEPWLKDAVPENPNLTGLVSFDQAVAHFVKTLEKDFSHFAGNAFDPSKFTGEVFNPFIDAPDVIEQSIVFNPETVSEGTATKGTYTIKIDGVETETGTYEFVFGRRVLAFKYMDGEVAKSKYLVSLAYNTSSNVYSVCAADGSTGIATLVSNCDLANARNINKVAFNQTQKDEEIVSLKTAAEKLAIELEEDFETTTENFFTSLHKRVAQSLSSGPLYYKSGGSAKIEDGVLVLDGDRITIGNETPEKASGEKDKDLAGTGIYNASQGFSISFDVVDASAEGTFYIYIDNNSASQGLSRHGANSKLIQVNLATGETTEGGLVTLGATLPKLEVGKRVTYTYEGSAFDNTQKSYFQLRAAGGTVIKIDNLEIDTIAKPFTGVEVPDGPSVPVGPVEPDFNVFLPFSAPFSTFTGDLFSSATQAIDGTVDSSGAKDPMFYKTGGTVELTSNGVKLDGGRFTIGHSDTSFTSTGTDTVNLGVFDLSEPYYIVMDVKSVLEETAGKKFQVYIDNNTSGSSNSMHGGSSRIYNEAVGSIPLGELKIPGDIGTENSFIQLRTEGGAVIEVDNFKIEYQNSFVAPVFDCADAAPEVYYCNDFSDGSLDDWDTSVGPDDGTFDILTLKNGNKVMRFSAGGTGGVLATLKDSVLANVPSADYFVEMKIRPRDNSTTANKQLYILGRYLDEDNWYGAGLNMQTAVGSRKAEISTKLKGKQERPSQVQYPFDMGAKNETEDGTFYTVRFEVIGDTITQYVDGELIGSHTVSADQITAKGLVGLFTNNRSFELDDVKIGDASVKPVLLSTDFSDVSWTGSALGDELTLNVTAKQKDGSDDTYSVESSNPAVASVTMNGGVVTVKPLAEGEAVIYLTSASDSSVIRQLPVVVGPAFTDSSTDYGDLASKVTPLPGDKAQYIDASLTIEFDAPPTLGTSGVVRIFEKATDTQVDEIKVSGDMDKLAYNVAALGGRTRDVNYRPFMIDGNKLTIKPHNNILEYGKEYYIVVGNDVVTGAQINGVDFDGIGKAADWSFTTKASAPTGTDLVVDDDGFADFRTLQGALNYAMEDKNTAMTITIKDGIYNELLYLRNKNNLTIQGESRDNTIVQYDNSEGFNGGSSSRGVFLVESADNLVLNNFTLKNTHVRTGSGDQAETIYFNSSHRLIANNMNFISEQDTLLMKGYNWFYNCLIAGNVDFIWGYSVATLFENSEIRTIGDSKNAPNDTSGGYVLQARVQNATDPGFVFMNNEFTSGAGPLGNGVLDNSTYIARSSGDGNVYDNIVLINNKLGSHIITDGWADNTSSAGKQPDPNPGMADSATGWREYGSMDLAGNALDLTGRTGSAIADSNVANAPYATRADVFASYDGGNGWNPQPIDAPVIVDQPAAQGDGGFAGELGEVTGGAGGTIVTVDTGKALVEALAAAKSAGTPITVYVKGTITPANTDNATRSINIKDMNDVSIIGVGTAGEFDGIGIQIERANNVIIRNLKIHDVPKSFGDAIGIQSDQGQDDTSRIWIDHNELHGSLSVGKDDYDGLIDTRFNAKNITISYNYIHDHYKTMLNGSSDDASEKGDRYITWHHNYIANVESRTPLFRYGFGHLYNNYFHNITGSAINSRMGAELLVENNVFENVKNPIVSLDSTQKGLWNVRGNEFINVTYSPAGNLNLAEETTFEIEGKSTSTYEVSYDYADHLMDAADVKNYVLANAGIGKIDQSGDTIPDIVDNSGNGGNGGNGGTPTAPAGSIVESFAAANRAEFFSATYKAMPTDSNLPLYVRTGGGVDPVNGELVIGGSSGGRFTIGDLDAGSVDTADTVAPNGVLDLSAGVVVSFKLVDIQALADDKSFIVYVDNNTSSSSKSLHGGSSKIPVGKVSELVGQIGQTITIDTDLGTAASFIQLRAESNVLVTIDDLVITPKTKSITEDFSAADQAEFLSAAYKALLTDASAPMYIRTGGGVEIVNGELVLGGSSGGRFTIGDTGTEESAENVDPKGTLDLSNGATVSFKLVDAQGDEKGFFVYLDNNTSSSSKSLHGGSSKITIGKLADLTPQIGQTVTVDVPAGTTTSFLQLRTESNLTVTIDDLVITPK